MRLGIVALRCRDRGRDENCRSWEGLALSPRGRRGGSHPRVLSRGVTRSDLDFKTIQSGVKMESGLESVSPVKNQCENENVRSVCNQIRGAGRLQGWICGAALSSQPQEPSSPS